MRELWQNRLVLASRKLRVGDDYPVWWDGFHNVMARNESSDDNDNPYLRPGNPVFKGRIEESPYYEEYRAGALAAESLKKAIAREPSE